MPGWIYTLLLYLLLPLALLKLGWRAIRQPEYLRHIPERFGFYRLPRPTQPLIWLHAVSVGETRAAAPLVAQLRSRYPGHAILLTQTTPTGRATAAQLFGDEVLRVYLPYDLSFAMRRFLRHFRPRIGLLMETELWFNLIAACRAQQVPLLLVNARLSEKSARGYARLGTLTRDGLRRLTALAAQTEDDAARLRQLGAPTVTVMGNLKFDVTPPAAMLQLGRELRQRFGAARPVFLAASTRNGEEELILDALRAAGVPQLLAVIVPRHPQRFGEVASLLEKRGLVYQRRSQLQAGTPSPLAGEGRGEGALRYADVPGLCKAATLKEIEAQGWSLNPGRYVGVAPGEEVSDEDFKEQLETLNEELESLNAQARELEATIASNVAEILEA